VCFQTVFNILFGNDEFTKRFHKKFNYDPDAEASDWNENNERVVKYVATTQAPRMIAKIAGKTLGFSGIFSVIILNLLHKNKLCCLI
jgi:hypothetical protein